MRRREESSQPQSNDRVLKAAKSVGAKLHGVGRTRTKGNLRRLGGFSAFVATLFVCVVSFAWSGGRPTWMWGGKW